MLCDVLQIDRSQLVLPDKSAFDQTATGKNDTELFIKKGNYYEQVEGI
jgi:hypothetical protein